MTLSIRIAETIIASAKERALEAKCALSIAVVDAGGHLVAAVRMDGATFMTLEMAQGKAFTSAASGMQTAVLATLMANASMLDGPPAAGGRSLTLAAGGLPIVIDGKLAGAAGASGGPPDIDIACIRAGLDAVGAN